MDTLESKAVVPDKHKLPSHFRDPAKMEWMPTNFPGIRIKLLYKNDASGLFTALFDWAPGAVLPLHEHVELEQTYMLEGDLYDDEMEVTAGQYVSRPPGSRHIAKTRTGCRFIAVFLKPNIFFADDGSASAFNPAAVR